MAILVPNLEWDYFFMEISLQTMEKSFDAISFYYCKVEFLFAV